MARGLFITLEGGEGAGKTTQMPHLAEYLTGLGHQVVATREPGGTAIGRRIRAILLDPDSVGLVPAAELLLYAADRAQHAGELILPALSAGKTVICDRYYDATLAYQGFGRGLDRALIEAAHGAFLQEAWPDLTLLFDIPPESGLARARSRKNGDEGRFEAEELGFHRRVREGYRRISEAEPKRFAMIDADADPETVRGRMLGAVRDFLRDRGRNG